MDKYIPIGRVSKTHGVDGAVKLKIKERYWDDFAEAKILFVELVGKPYLTLSKNSVVATIPL
jgi:ribosomal 30S subunit maturation factor RimM